MNEIILLTGPQASGKSTFAQEYIEKGYVHLNRDKVGGSLAKLEPLLEKALQENRNVILDNTFGTKKSRKPFLEIAKKYNVPVKCYSFQISLNDAIFNSVYRIYDKYRRLFNPKDLKLIKDPHVFHPAVIKTYFKFRENPELFEGFSSIEEVIFQRKYDPDFKNKALFLDFDGTLRKTKSGEDYPRDIKDIEILPNRTEKLKEFADKGYKLIGVSNQSGVDKGKVTAEIADRCLNETVKLLKIKEFPYLFCPHQSHPIVCLCRKPMPMIGIWFMKQYNLDLRQCIMVGDYKTDKEFAEICGMKFEWADEFFKL